MLFLFIFIFKQIFREFCYYRFFKGFLRFSFIEFSYSDKGFQLGKMVLKPTFWNVSIVSMANFAQYVYACICKLIKINCSEKGVSVDLGDHSILFYILFKVLLLTMFYITCQNKVCRFSISIYNGFFILLNLFFI